MSSAIAGSAATAFIISPSIHNLGNNLSSNTPVTCSFASIYTPEVIRRRSSTVTSHDEMSLPLFIEERKITINIQGTLFETFQSTLSKYPDTLLGCSQKRQQYYDLEKKQFCFERHREAFNSILYYYQSSGKLIRPYDVPEDIFLDDLKFFEIDPWNVAELEYGNENFTKPEKTTLKDTENESIGLIEEDDHEEKLKTTPVSCDNLLSWPCVCFVIVYVLSTCLSTQPDYQSVLPTSCENITSVQPITTKENPIAVIHIACTLWFSFEFLLRFTLSIKKVRYLISFIGFIDIICVLTTFLQITVRHADVCQHGLFVWFVNFLRAASFSCIFKLSRYSRGLHLFGQTIKACSGQFILSLYCVGICLLVFATLVYYAEFPTNDGIYSIIDALWYAIVTLTTVGYGDLVPNTLLGKTTGALCSVFGVTIVMAWPATIFVSHFTDIYSHEVVRKKKNKKSFWSRGFYKFKKGLVGLDKRACSFK